MNQPAVKSSGFSKYALGLLVYNLLVILWGAYVRATGSGAGCGRHWPLCNGAVVPRAPAAETIVEYTHRLMSGLVLLLALVLVIWAFRKYPKRSLLRKSSVWVLIFTLTEALVGAGLVLFELTADDDSVARAVSISVHLVNTFLLLGAITVTTWWATRGAPAKLSWPKNGVLLIIGLLATMLIGASGAITALGDTLFPALSLAEGFSQDFDPTAHFLLRLRIYHPLIAVIASGYIGLLVGWSNQKIQSTDAKRLGKIIIGIIALQLIAGAMNVVLLAPVWLQLVHLLLADLIWISLVIFTNLIFSSGLLGNRFSNRTIEIGIEEFLTK